MDNINGIPLIWNEEEDNQLFGQIMPLINNYSSDLNTTQKSIEDISKDYALQSPFGDQSIFIGIDTKNFQPPKII